ncbi:MAG: fimbria/pilus outer membrane usher protein [Collimonas sp.]|uniref:fimbria/pilus outer membrane usher protein n=1 Tax=Collimonas sp. TaxID=1963772 RepID=UPI0032643EA9
MLQFFPSSARLSQHIPSGIRPPCCALVLLALASTNNASAQEVHADVAPAAVRLQVAQVEFNSGFFNPGSTPLDVSRFSRGNPVLPGTFRTEIFVNGNWLSRADIRFVSPAGQRDAVPCITRDLLPKLGVKMDHLREGGQEKLADPAACVQISEIVDGAFAEYDGGELRLNLSIPQIALNRSARGYVGPELWDDGINAATLGYNLNATRSSTGNSSSTQVYTGLDGGLHLGPWLLRHTGNATWSDQASGRAVTDVNGSPLVDANGKPVLDANGNPLVGAPNKGRLKYQSTATTLQHDLPALKGQLILGDTFTSGELFDSIAVRGATIASDDRMLPDSLRGYAPVVRGVARTNARVKITQNGNILLETTVAPGAFEINDLYPTGYGGDIDVEVMEADGQVQRFKMPFAALPRLLREGGIRYSLTAGQLRDRLLQSKLGMLQGTIQYGFNNTWSGYAGVVSSDGYLAGQLGAAVSTPAGAFSADATQARTELPGIGSFTGSSYGLSYNKLISETSTNFALAAYRYSTSGYFGLRDALFTRDQLEQSQNPNRIARQRSRATLSLSQRLGEKGGSVYLNTSLQNYWNQTGVDKQFQLGYGNIWRDYSYNFTASRVRDLQGTSSVQLYAGITIPLGSAALNSSAQVSMTRNSGGDAQLQSSVNSTFGDVGQYSTNVGVNASSGGRDTSGNFSGQYRAPYANLSANLSAGQGFNQVGFGMQGGIVAHAGGVTLAQSLGETVGLVEAKDAAGAALSNSVGAKVDSQGYAVVPYLTPYSMNTVEIDPKGLSLDVELGNTSAQIAPRAGSVVKLKFATVNGRAALIDGTLEDGAPVPFGAEVLNPKGESLGAVGQGGSIFVRGAEDSGSLTVKWGDQPKQSCALSYVLPPRQKDAKGVSFDKAVAVCAPLASPVLSAVDAAKVQDVTSAPPALSAAGAVAAKQDQADGLLIFTSVGNGG